MLWPKEAKAQCLTLPSFKVDVLPQMPPNTTVTPLLTKDIPDFLKRFNASPPPSQFEADDVEIVVGVASRTGNGA